MTAANKNTENGIDDSFEEEEGEARSLLKISRKKIILILIPILILIGGGGFTIFSKFNTSNANPNFHVVQKTKETLFLYDLPPLNIALQPAQKNQKSKDILRVAISLEASRHEDIKFIDNISSQISDIIISHVFELYSGEVKGINNLHWLREELLYRINLVAEPVKINNLNFRTFEIVSE